jgi:hypothetical protein
VHPNCDADSLGGDTGNSTERRVRDACAAALSDVPTKKEIRWWIAAVVAL